MRFEDLYSSCFDLNWDSIITVLEEGKKPVEAKIEDIYDEIYDRQVVWFSVENSNMILIKLKGE